MTKIFSSRHYEVWAKFDPTAKVYELFASRDATDYIGCADTKAEALKVAKRWVDENLSA